MKKMFLKKEHPAYGLVNPDQRSFFVSGDEFFVHNSIFSGGYWDAVTILTVNSVLDGGHIYPSLKEILSSNEISDSLREQAEKLRDFLTEEYKKLTEK